MHSLIALPSRDDCGHNEMPLGRVPRVAQQTQLKPVVESGRKRLSEGAPVVSQAAQRRELHKPSGSASSLSSVEILGSPVRQSEGRCRQALLGTTVNQQHSSEFDIQRILELALRKLDTGSDGERCVSLESCARCIRRGRKYHCRQYVEA